MRSFVVSILETNVRYGKIDARCDGGRERRRGVEMGEEGVEGVDTGQQPR